MFTMGNDAYDGDEDQHDAEDEGIGYPIHRRTHYHPHITHYHPYHTHHYSLGSSS